MAISSKAQIVVVARARPRTGSFPLGKTCFTDRTVDSAAARRFVLRPEPLAAKGHLDRAALQREARALNESCDEAASFVGFQGRLPS